MTPPTPSREHGATKEVADHEFHVDIFDNPATATQCRRVVGVACCSIPRDQHPRETEKSGQRGER